MSHNGVVITHQNIDISSVKTRKLKTLKGTKKNWKKRSKALKRKYKKKHELFSPFLFSGLNVLTIIFYNGKIKNMLLSGRELEFTSKFTLDHSGRFCPK